MNPDDAVLVALLNNRRDYDLAAREHWHRIRVRGAPRFFASAQYIAFYLSRSFGDERWTIAEYASVRGHELVRRRDLLPDEPDHPRADELYYKLELGPLERLEPPLTSRRGYRLLFLWTTGQRFSAAHQVDDLFRPRRTEGPLAGGSGSDPDGHPSRARDRIDYYTLRLRAYRGK